MGEISQLNDLDLAALVSSKICHDAIGSMTAIGFGLDVLDEDEDDEEQRENALAMIRNGAGAITAKVQFARLAFGAAGSSGFEIDLQEAQSVGSQLCREAKKSTRSSGPVIMRLSQKNHVKLLLNLVAISMGTVPRGGTLHIAVEGDKATPVFTIKAVGPKARVPEGLVDLVNVTPQEEVDARSIQSYFAGRIAKAIGAKVEIGMDGDDVLISVGFNS